ncbi:unnamed protein product [Rotaria magnacalcarata]|uniref:dual-specificity kinase n=1 Tax=Rotaria magnacalcarata TaxID=392030 RepID=A0A819PNV2_9BILA|nr:unnamed protein product [Rotaria magnacalcarata]CAF2126720.1 unnamed protein product [Rotaria magnacalcarata]CAF2171267.1 unnamed protein product [Rotaria magnacalcarata]CAF3963572.1 unnamed protein product [Rotaria magnacalcarata]CAF4015760.1 unnamed protein product [Rotaria magnacalcarata]
MSSESMINVEHRQTISNLFHKFIRMTVKQNNLNKKYKKKQTTANIQQINHFYSSSTKTKQNCLVQSLATSSIDQKKFISNIHFSNSSNTSNQNSSYSYRDNNQEDNFHDQSNNGSTGYGSGPNASGVDLRDMENSFGDIGLSITSKPLAKVQKFSVQTVLNGSFPRVGDKQQQQQQQQQHTQQLTNGNRSVKSYNILNNDSSLPFLNDSVGSGGTSARLHQTIVHHSHNNSNHHHHGGAAAVTARSLRREKTREGSLKSSSKDTDITNNHNLYHHHNTSASSIISSSHQFSRSRSFFNNNSTDNINKMPSFPMKPSEALSYYGDKLTEFEKNEIFDFNEIYFLGLEAEKISATNVKDYDDENGSYMKMSKDHICYRFEILETLGKGSFGLVLRCYDHKKKETVALKIIRNKKRFQQQGLVEVNILTHLKTLDSDNSLNIVHVKEHFYFRSHLCITFELLGINLYELIKKNNYQGFSVHLVRRFANSLLQCLRVMFREKIIHCDLKPENILLRQKGSSSIKVIDFGSGCFQAQRIYTYIQSRFYRAPEIILGIPYTPAIDMWSFGCILVELFTGYPIFPGENEQEQLSMIMEVIDLPPNHVLEQGTRRKLFFDSKGIPRSVTTKTLKKRRPASRPLGQILRTTDQNFIDFIRRCFEWDPVERLTPEEGLRHPWIIETKLKQRTSRESKNKYRTKKDENISTVNADSYFSLNETTGNEENIPNDDDKQTLTNAASITILPRISNQ